MGQASGQTGAGYTGGSNSSINNPTQYGNMGSGSYQPRPYMPPSVGGGWSAAVQQPTAAAGTPPPNAQSKGPSTPGAQPPRAVAPPPAGTPPSQSKGPGGPGAQPPQAIGAQPPVQSDVLRDIRVKRTGGVDPPMPAAAPPMPAAAPPMAPPVGSVDHTGNFQRLLAADPRLAYAYQSHGNAAPWYADMSQRQQVSQMMGGHDKYLQFQRENSPVSSNAAPLNPREMRLLNRMQGINQPAFDQIFGPSSAEDEAWINQMMGRR